MFCLFWPLRLLWSLRRNEAPVRYWLYNLDPTETELPEEYKHRKINVPVRLLVKDLVDTFGYTSLVFPIGQASILLGIYWYIWYVFASTVSPDSIKSYLPVLFIFLLIYLANVAIIKAKILSDTYLPLGFLFVLFIVLPAAPTKSPVVDLEFTSNQLVASILRASKLGGGAVVSIDPAIAVDGRTHSKVQLIFYDGNHAWVKPCAEANIAVIETAPNSIAHHKHSICP